MAATKLHGKSLDSYADINIDELLEQLTEAEIEELGLELIDPDDSCIPPSDRCRYRTDKAPTGPFDRKKLLDFIEKKAKEEKDWDEAKPFKKEIRGKIWKRKEEKVQMNDDEDVDTEWDEILSGATEEELVDLAAILGFHGMLNQVQYHQAFVENREILGGGGFQGVASHENFKTYEDDAPNSTDVEAALKGVKDNDPKLKDVNLNNIKNISIERLIEFADALKKNTNVEHMHLANTRATEKVAKKFAAALHDNKTLKSINLESNYISGEGIVALLEGINVHKVVSEFRISNQRPSILGNKIEVRIADLLRENVKLLKFGIFLETPGPRVAVSEYMKRNNDNLRKGRVGEDLWEAPKPKERPVKKVDLDTEEKKEAPKQETAPPKKVVEEEDEDSEEESEEETESSEEEE